MKKSIHFSFDFCNDTNEDDYRIKEYLENGIFSKYSFENVFVYNSSRFEQNLKSFDCSIENNRDLIACVRHCFRRGDLISIAIGVILKGSFTSIDSNKNLRTYYAIEIKFFVDGVPYAINDLLYLLCEDSADGFVFLDRVWYPFKELFLITEI